MEILRNFAVFEGGDGSGTTTQLALLRRRFEAGGEGLPPFHATSEPTSGPVGRLLRAGLRGEFRLAPLTAALLFAADRNEHLFGESGDGGVAARCAAGELVVSDRCTLSSLVYQGISLGDDVPFALNERFPLPELLLFFDIAPETAWERVKDRPVREVFENLPFQTRVRERYRAWLPRLAGWGVRTVTLDAALPPEEIGEKVWAEIQKMPIFKGRETSNEK
jgi:dTMP kinase